MPQSHNRIGRLLVEQQVITEDQCRAILDEQGRTHRPFGEIAEELFEINARAVENAWAEQYARLARWVDPTIEHIDPAVLALVSRRQAWQFGVLPIGYDRGELLICTTRDRLIRALNFTTRHIAERSYLALATPDAMGQALMRCYPMDGMSREMLVGDGPPQRLAG